MPITSYNLHSSDKTSIYLTITPPKRLVKESNAVYILINVFDSIVMN